MNSNENIVKIESKIYLLTETKKEAIAEVVSNCGCGFDYLIRIHPEHKHDLPIFAKCMELCGIAQKDINIDYDYIDGCYKREYLIQDERIAVVVDKII